MLNIWNLIEFSNFMFYQTNFNFPNDYDIAVFFINPRLPQNYNGKIFLNYLR